MGSPGDVGPRGSLYGSGDRESGGKHGQETSFWSLWGRQGEGRQVGLGLAVLKNFGGLWGEGSL